MSDARSTHWRTVYASKPATGVSWHQARPDLSLALIDHHAPDARSAIDVGGGASPLVDHLLEKGLERVAVADLSPEALAASRARLGPAAERVTWIAGDVMTTPLPGPVDLWHDRALFHFLTEAADRAAYVRALDGTLAPEGVAIIATFAPDGPERCSGLPVVRYAPETLTQELGPAWRLVDSASEQHRTPAGALQSFQYSVFRRA